MNRSILFVLSLVVGIFTTVSALAEEAPESQEGGERGDGHKKKMMGKMGGGMRHQQPSVTATSDGGVVILAGPKLLKYDAQLNLVNEIELKMGPKPGDKPADGESAAAEAPHAA